ncbi:MAG: hypothetical protein JRF33_25670 [Deltaproteobacteria bacterium]|nr:hypothetical protein [Deltaproteobacteria bacterium]
MAKCKIFLHMDKTDFRQLEKITGEVRVQVNEDCKCKALTIQTGWKTQGWGRMESGMGTGATLFSGTWRAGNKYRYPFQLATTVGPCSYDGDLIKLEWQAWTQADIPWASDPKAAKKIVLLPGAVKNYFNGKPMPDQASDQEVFSIQNAAKMTKGQRARLMIGLLLMVLSFMKLAEGWHHKTPWSDPLQVIGILVFLLGLGLLLYEPFHAILTTSKLGHITLSIKPLTFFPGQIGEILLQVPEAGDSGMTRIIVELQARESATKQTQHHGRSLVTGEKYGTRQQVVYTQVMEENSEDLGVTPGQPYQSVIPLQIPQDAPLSLDLKWNRLDWSVSVRLEIPPWPNWKRTQDIRVLPSRDFVAHPHE